MVNPIDANDAAAQMADDFWKHAAPIQSPSATAAAAAAAADAADVVDAVPASCPTSCVAAAAATTPTVKASYASS